MIDEEHLRKLADAATDTDVLVEKALWGLTRVYDDPHGGTVTFVHAPVHEVVTAVLPLVAEEKRKAKAEALREAADILECHPLDEPDAAHTPNWLYDRAAEHETGDSDEHR